MGSGQCLGDPFLAHIHRLLCGKVLPDIHKGKLLVSWTLDHVIRYNTGGIGGDQQIVVLSSKNNDWRTERVDAGEIRQQVSDIEKHIENYPALQKEKEVSPDTPDVRTILDSEGE